MTNKEKKFVIDVHKEMLKGTYSPENVNKAYSYIYGDHNIPNKAKRRHVYNYVTYHMDNDMVNEEKQGSITKKDVLAIEEAIKEKQAEGKRYNAHTIYLATKIDKEIVEYVLEEKEKS